VARAWPFTVDDTYITLRYSRNLAEGLGPTFNASGPRAEGYTTFLWMLVLAVPHRLGLDAALLAKAVGVAATFATLGIAASWARAQHPERPEAATWAGVAAATCLAAIPATAVHAVSGMETALFTLLLTALLASCSSAARGGAAIPRIAVLSLLLGLTRPEGNVAAFVAIGVTALGLAPPARVRLLGFAALGWALPVAVYELWRRHYYGLPFPLPFYVKLAAPGRLPGWPDVWAWLGGPALHFGVLALPVLWCRASGPPALVRPPRPLRPALAVLAVLTTFFIFPQHQMGYDHRYLAPLDPVLAVLAGVGLGRLVEMAASARPAWQGRRAAAAAGAIVAGAVLEASGTRAVVSTEAAYGEGLAAAHERLGRELLALGLPGARLAISDAGAVPYFSRWWTLDLVGLNDAAIATTGRRDPATVLAQAPDVVVLASSRDDRVEPWDWNTWEPGLFDACVAAGFVRVGLRRFADDYWLWVMARPGSAAAVGLAAVDHPPL
jgi:hypothetical protein